MYYYLVRVNNIPYFLLPYFTAWSLQRRGNIDKNIFYHKIRSEEPNWGSSGLASIRTSTDSGA